MRRQGCLREREAPARTGNSNSGRAGETQTGRTNQISGVEGKFLSRPKGGQEMDTRQVSKPEMAGNFTLTVAGRGHCGPFGLVRGRGGMCFPLETTGSGRMWAEQLCPAGTQEENLDSRAGESRRRGRKFWRPARWSRGEVTDSVAYIHTYIHCITTHTLSNLLSSSIFYYGFTYQPIILPNLFSTRQGWSAAV